MCTVAGQLERRVIATTSIIVVGYTQWDSGSDQKDKLMNISLLRNSNKCITGVRDKGCA